MSQIQIHFDGDLATNHQVSMRTLGKTLTHLQNAMDRAYIENKYGEVWKHARMRVADYDESSFLVQEPKEGGYILDFLASNEVTKGIVDRLTAAIEPALEKAKHEGEQKTRSIAQDMEDRISQVNLGISEPIDYQELIANPGKKVLRKYGDRTITREIDQILSIVRSKYSGESTFELSTYGTKSHTFLFDRDVSKKFHSVISGKALGDPVIFKVRVSQLDFKQKNGKIVNLANDNQANIKFTNNKDFFSAKKFLGTNEAMIFIGCPMIEYGAYDPNAGDIYFMGLV